jgi:predicted DNA-binding ribbon-helix-helix protein
MKSSIVKRSIVLAGHKTSVSLEEPFYQALKDIAASRRVTLSDLVAGIDNRARKRQSLVGDTAVRAQSLSGGHGIT